MMSIWQLYVCDDEQLYDWNWMLVPWQVTLMIPVCPNNVQTSDIFWLKIKMLGGIYKWLQNMFKNKRILTKVVHQQNKELQHVCSSQMWVNATLFLSGILYETLNYLVIF